MTTGTGIDVKITVDTSTLEADIANKVKETIKEVRPETAEDIAKNIRDGKSQWNVDTGLSRDSFYADGTVIKNSTEYAPFVEKGEAVKRLNIWIKDNVASVMSKRIKELLSG